MKTCPYCNHQCAPTATTCPGCGHDFLAQQKAAVALHAAKMAKAQADVAGGCAGCLQTWLFLVFGIPAIAIVGIVILAILAPLCNSKDNQAAPTYSGRPYDSRPKGYKPNTSPEFTYCKTAFDFQQELENENFRLDTLAAYEEDHTMPKEDLQGGAQADSEDFAAFAHQVESLKAVPPDCKKIHNQLRAIVHQAVDCARYFEKALSSKSERRFHQAKHRYNQYKAAYAGFDAAFSDFRGTHGLP